MEAYINSAFAISPQDTFDTENFLQEVAPASESYACLTPEYKNYIDPRQLRRMSKVIRMGVACAKMALDKAKIEVPDAIVIGTGLGCLDDTDKFLKQLLENNESLLNPTAFIQSTHNTVSGQIALSIGCKNYNLTYSQGEVSFETALIDAILHLDINNKKQALVGGIDELIDTSLELMRKNGCIKKSVDNSVLTSGTTGYIAGEGSTFFNISKEKSELNIAKIAHISAFHSNHLEIEKILNDLNIGVNDIDVLISGENGDSNSEPAFNNIKTLFPSSTLTAYKHLVGEYNTASAFALWLGSKILEKQSIPEAIKTNDKTKDSINKILIHHYTPEYHHSFILLESC